MNSEWKQSTLGELCQIKHGYAFKGEFFADAGDFILLTPGNFKESGGLQHKGEKEKFYVGEIPLEFVLNKGDLLLAMTDLTQNAPILGSPAFVPASKRYLHNQRLGKITNIDTKRLSPEFLFFLLNSRSVRGQIKGSASGATVRHTSPSRIYEVKVAIPSLSIQRKIASILSAYDDLIENNARRIAILEAMAQAIYREWFVEFRFPGHEKVKFVDSPLGKIPEGWRCDKLKNVCDSINYGFTTSARKEVVGPKFLRITDIVPNVIDWENVPYCELPPDDFDKYALNEGDIVIARTGATTGYAKRLNKRHPEAIFASYLVRIRPNVVLGKHYIGVVVESDKYKEFIKRNLSGAAQPQANAQVLTSLDVLVPSQEVIQSFDSQVESLVDQKEIVQIKNRNLHKTRDLLLPKLISGQLDVEYLDIDVGEIAPTEEVAA